jgi:uncharacterized membrane protein
MKFEKFWDDLRVNLWFRPAVWIITLSILALILLSYERSWSQNALSERLSWLFSGGADGARVILGTISGATVAAATLSFSIVFVAVLQTANAYSPRILRLYVGDTANQHVLGIFTGTFIFSLLILRAVRTADEGVFVPTLGIAVAILLSLLSLGALIYFIDHIAHSVEVDNIISLIMRETVDLLDELFPGTLGQPYPLEIPPNLPNDLPAVVTPADSGYIQYIEPETLLAAATERDLLVRLERLSGDYVLSGTTPLARVWPATALDESATEMVRDAFQLGTERTLVQDLFFGVRQLTDIALKAISPAVNDPSTAVNSIDALATLLNKMIRLEPISPYRCDAAGHLRVIAPGPTFEATLDLAFTQIRQYAASDFACTLRLIEVCGELAYATRRPAYQTALWRHVRMVAHSANQNFVQPGDRAEINKGLLLAAENLGQDPQPLLLAG